MKSSSKLKICSTTISHWVRARHYPTVCQSWKRMTPIPVTGSANSLYPWMHANPQLPRWFRMSLYFRLRAWGVDGVAEPIIPWVIGWQ